MLQLRLQRLQLLPPLRQVSMLRRQVSLLHSQPRLCHLHSLLPRAQLTLQALQL